MYRREWSQNQNSRKWSLLGVRKQKVGGIRENEKDGGGQRENTTNKARYTQTDTDTKEVGKKQQRISKSSR